MEPILSAASPAPADLIKETDTARFKTDVIDASMKVPVIVDFWAPWCGPCKQLAPVLEKVVKAARGKVRLVKLNTDENQQLAAQMRIQSIPAVYAFFQGRPVDGFVGALPESQLKAFIDKLAKLAANGADDGGLEEVLDEARELLDAGDFRNAGSLYSQILQHEPGQPVAIAGLARALIGLGELKQAKQVLDDAPPEAAKSTDIASVRSQIELTEQSRGAAAKIPALMERLAADKDDHEARLDLAMALYAAGKREAAVDELLEAIRRDRDWNDQAARKQLLKLFEAFGPADKLTLSARRKLSSILFS